MSSYQWQFNGTNIAKCNQWIVDAKECSIVRGRKLQCHRKQPLWCGRQFQRRFVCHQFSAIYPHAANPQAVIPGTNTALSVSAGGSLPIYYQWQFNGTNIGGATNNVLSFAAVLPADRGYYDVVLSNAYGTVVSSNVFLHVLDAGDALNATNLVWLSGGDAPWFVENGSTYDVTHDGLAMQSGAITAGQESTIQTTVTGPGTLTYWWNVSSWPVTDYLEFSVNGLEQARISGYGVYYSYGWEARTNYLGAGPQVLEWAYTKTDSRVGPSGQDSGWLDDVNYTPGGTPPFLSLSPTNQVVLLGANASLNGAAQGTPPLSYQWQLNQVNIDGATSTNLNLTNVQFAVEGNYTLVISNAFGVASSAPAFLNVVDFTEAANATNLVWNSGGNQPWFPETATTHDGVAALQSGAIAGGQQSALLTTVNGPGTLSFWWKVSSETNNDYASFSEDGSEQSRISGTVNWQQRTYYLTPGTHTLTWTYSKNATINSGSDAAWLDQVSYIEGTTAVFIASNPTDQVVALSSNATFAVLAQGTPPFSYQWFFDNNNIPDATNATLTINNVRLADVGDYTVAVTNDYGGVISANANLYLLSVYAWGAGRSNTLTTPNFGQSMVPTNLASVTAIAAGGYHNLALLPNGSVKAWGYNSYGETNVPTTLTNAMAVAAGLYHSLALRSNGTMTAWGNSTFNQTVVPASATNVTAIAAGWYHNLALRSNGTVVAWGAGTSQGSPPFAGQSIVPPNLAGVTAVAAGGYHSLALRTNGTVVAWGWNAAGQINVPGGLSNVIAIAAGGSNSIALKNDGTLVAWGDNSFGQGSIPVGLSNVVAIAAGIAHNMALKNDGTLVLWGLNGNGQTNVPVGLTNIAAISAGAYHSTVLVNDRTPRIFGQILAPRVYTGSSVLLCSGIVGAVPMSYQWRFNGTNLDAATNAVLLLTNVAFSAAGYYSCIASNAYGVVSNSNMTLSVLRSTLQFLPASLSMTTNGSFAFILGSLSGHGSIIIYHSTNLIDWQPICTNAPVIGTLPFTDSSAKNSPIQFYRAVEQ